MLATGKLISLTVLELSIMTAVNDLKVHMTEPAARHVRTQLLGADTTWLRLGVKESGCNGYMYTLDFLPEPSTEDHQIVINQDIHICVDPAHVSLVNDTEMDLVTAGLNATLVFRNANAESYCGCGESFALPEEGLPDAAATAALAHNVATGESGAAQ